jgi:hypothetical protein
LSAKYRKRKRGPQQLADYEALDGGKEQPDYQWDLTERERNRFALELDVYDKNFGRSKHSRQCPRRYT